MRIVGHELGRVIALFPLEEVRPERGVPLLDLVTGIRERYRFIKIPDLTKTTQDLNREGLAFESGSFSCDGETVAVRELTIYNDGVSISCYNTKYADAFLEDILHWAGETFSIKKLSQEPKRIYRSTVIVDFNISMNNSARNFMAISRLIQEAYNQYTGHDIPVSLNRIDFRMDDTKVPGIPPVGFVLERRVGVAHEIERYISEVPLPSDAHIEYLQSLENLLN